MEPYYQADGITLFYGDATHVVPRLGTFGLLLTDPPYGINHDRDKGASSVGRRSNLGPAKAWDVKRWDKAPPERWVLEMMVNRADHSIIWGGNFMQLPPSPGWLVWDKDNTGDFADAELAWTNIDMPVRKLTYRWNGMIQQDMKNKETKWHPAQKPLALMRWCIGHAAGTTSILDPYCGSGSTLIAARDLGIQAVGIESDKDYCDVVVERLKERVLPLYETPKIEHKELQLV